MVSEQAFPVFTPWSNGVMSVYHHRGRLVVAEIREHDGHGEVTWDAFLPFTVYASTLEAVAGVRDSYSRYLEEEEKFHQGDRERDEYEERFLKRQAGLVARAYRVPMGGQKGWRGPSS